MPFAGADAAKCSWWSMTICNPSAPRPIGPTQDNDKDGTYNLAECAFNLNPTQPDIAALKPGTGTAGLPSIRLTGAGNAQHPNVIRPPQERR